MKNKPVLKQWQRSLVHNMAKCNDHHDMIALIKRIMASYSGVKAQDMHDFLMGMQEEIGTQE